MAMDVSQFKGIQGTQGFVRTDSSNNLTTFGTNFLSRAVGWNQASKDQNELLRIDFAKALKTEFGGTPEGNRFVKDMEALLLKNDNIGKPLELRTVKNMIDRGETMKARYDQSTPQGRELRQLDQARSLANMYTDFNAPGASGLMYRANLRTHVEAAVKRMGLEGEMQQYIKQEVANGKTADAAKTAFLDKLMTPSMLYHVRSEIMAASNMGKGAVTKSNGVDIDGFTVGDKKIGDMVDGGIDKSKTLSDLKEKFAQIDSFRLSPEERRAARQAALEHPDAPFEKFMEDHFGRERYTALRAEVAYGNRTLIDEFAPDLELRTAFSGKQMAQTQEIFQQALGSKVGEGRTVRDVLTDLNKGLPDGQKIKLYGDDTFTFMKSLLPGVREELSAVSDKGKRALGEQDVLDAFNKILQDKARMLDQGMTAGKKAGMSESEASAFAIKREKEDGDFVSTGLGAKFGSGQNVWANLNFIINEVANRRTPPDLGFKDKFAESMQEILVHVANKDNKDDIDRALSDPKLQKAFSKYLEENYDSTETEFGGIKDRNYKDFNNQSPAMILKSALVYPMQVVTRNDMTFKEVLKHASPESDESMRGFRGDFEQSTAPHIPTWERTTDLFAKVFTDEDFLRSIPAEHRDAIRTLGELYGEVRSGMQDKDGTFGQMKSFVGFALSNPDNLATPPNLKLAAALVQQRNMI